MVGCVGWVLQSTTCKICQQYYSDYYYYYYYYCYYYYYYHYYYCCPGHRPSADANFIVRGGCIPFGSDPKELP